MKNKSYFHLGLAGLISLQGLTSFGSNPKPLNILIIQTDEHNPGMFGAVDHVAITPNIDKIAKNGVIFRNAYCQNPISVPSRMSMLTGKYSKSINVFDNSDTLKMNFSTFADKFNEFGYTSAIIGKMDFGGSGEELRHGFIRPFGDPGSDFSNVDWQKQHLDAIDYAEDGDRLIENSTVIDDAVYPTYMEALKDGGVVPYYKTFMNDNNPNVTGKPFLLICSFVKPHFPFEVTKKYHDMYKGRVSLPIDNHTDHANWTSSDFLERNRYGLGKLTDAQTILGREVYYGMISWVDDQIGMILDDLDKKGLRDNTLILYIADHGDLAGEHGLWYKNSFYNGSAGIPFIVSYPAKFPVNTISNAITGNIDIFPTICDAAGIPKSGGLEGNSLYPFLTGQNTGEDRVIFSETYRNDIPGCMVRTSKWKYYMFPPTFKNGNKKESFLFDMVNDPNEMTNLAKNPANANDVIMLENKMAWWKGTSLGIINVQSQNNPLKIFPNPAISNVSLSVPVIGKYIVKIHNSTGICVFNKQIIFETEKYGLNINELNAGFYYVSAELSDNNNNNNKISPYTAKLIVR